MEADVDADQNFYSRGRPRYESPSRPATTARTTTTTNGYDDPELFYKTSPRPDDDDNEIDMVSATTTTASRNGIPQPTAASTLRGRPSYRSASAPTGYGKAPRPSVKELLQKFDQSNEGSPPLRRPGNQSLPRPRVTGSPLSPIAASPTTTNGVKSPIRSQRSRFAVEDQHSNNTLSSAPRTRTRTASTNPPVSRSAGAGTGSFAQKASQVPQKPLFGEVVSNGSGSMIAYGIDRSRRRTSDSSVRPGLTDAPSSPTQWYREFDARAEAEASTPRSASHHRSQSDQTSSKSATSREAVKLPKTQQPSRIPLMTVRANLSDSSRNSSPTGSPSARTPPTYTSSLRRPPSAQRTAYARREPPSTNNASLNAYIASPPPKTSPTLRSSRPRLPVSAASTASSRARKVEAYVPTNSRSASRQSDKRKIVDIGPVDFAARRERIVRQYTKSIHETIQVHKAQEPEEIPIIIPPVPALPKELPSEPIPAPPSPEKSVELSSNSPIDSPTLGIPGAFPSPPVEDEQNDSDTTEIDNEPQPDADPIPEYPLGMYVENEPAQIPDDRNDHLSIHIALDTLNTPDESPPPEPEREKYIDEVSQDYDTCDSLESSMISQPVVVEPENVPTPPEESCSEPEPEPEVEAELPSGTFLQEANPRISVAEVPNTHLIEIRAALNTESTPANDLEYESSESFTPEYSNSLQVSSSQTHRHSQNSIWTDYSIDTEDAEKPRLPMFTFESRSTSDIGKAEPVPEPSPRTSIAAQLSSPRKPRHITTPGGDVEPGLASPGRPPSIASNSSVPYWSDHAPPPIPKCYTNETPSLPQSPTSTSFTRPPSGVYKPSYSRISVDEDSRRPSEEGLAAEIETEEERKEKKRLFKRGNIIGELIETESSYLKDMHVVVEIYKGTAEACPKLETDDVRAIFRNIDQVVNFTSSFVDALRKSGGIYAPSKSRRSLKKSVPGKVLVSGTMEEVTDEKDRETAIGAAFVTHLEQMQAVYSDFLKNSESSNTRLQTLSADPAVRVWLDECIHAAQDLTNAWSLDALLVKPVQRITRYQLFLKDILGCTPDDHPDKDELNVAHDGIINILKAIDELKKRIHTVEKIVTRKRKESDVRSGLAKLVNRQARKYQTNPDSRTNDDQLYLKLHERYSDDFLRLQVVLRDVEFYTRQVVTFVKDWLRFLSGIEQMVRFKPSQHPELESKWVRFNMSMRDLETVVMENHVNAVRKQVIEPFETMIKAYGPPALAMNKRAKRRVDFEKANHLKSQGKKIDDKLAEQVEQYDALNETLKLELPKLSKLTETVANLSLVQFVNLQTEWWGVWVEKVKTVLEDGGIPRDATDILEHFARDYAYGEARLKELGIVNGSFKARSELITPRNSQSTTLVDSSTSRSSQSTTREDDASVRSKTRPPNLTTRTRESSVTSDVSPSLPTPEFLRTNGQFTLSPLPTWSGPAATTSASPVSPPDWYRPGTSGTRRESVESWSHSTRPLSGLFNSALPPEETEGRLSQTSSRDREPNRSYNVLYLAASLFEFNMEDTKMEAGYPYLTYQAGEIFDVIGEKGELWLAKNQDDPSDWVGWIWSKHFARLAD